MALKFQQFFIPIPDLIGFKRLSLLCFFGVLFAIQSSSAQLVCKDEMLIDAYFNCGTGPNFAPVCACDGQTYGNECAARYHGGIQGNNWVSGPCGEFYFVIYPTLCLNGNLMFRSQHRNRGRMQMYLINNFGSIELQRQFEVGTSVNTSFDVDVSTLPAGIYFFVVQGGSDVQIERFVVLPN